jgi:hypothetical protein
LDGILRDLEDKTKRSRQRGIELERLRQSLAELEEKRKALEVQRQFYVDYVQSCISNMQIGKRRKSTYDGKGKAPSQEFAEPAVFTADKLFAKGVLVELRDVPENQYCLSLFPSLSVTLSDLFILFAGEARLLSQSCRLALPLSLSW